jgi:hypothetical protein
MAYMNDAEVYRLTADVVLAAFASEEVEGLGTVYRLRDVAQAHADLEPAARSIASRDHSAGCSAAAGFLGAIQKASGRSNRKLACAARASRQIASAPTTPAIVTISETVPMS